MSSQIKSNRFTVRLQNGIYSEYNKLDKSSKGAIFGWGIDYSFIIKNKIYLAFDLGFPYYDTIFEAKRVKANPLFGNFSLSSIFLYFIPITYINIGYSYRNWIFTLGPAYLWGINSTVIKSINHNVSFEFRHTWFLDRLIYDDGFHDMHFLFSFRYTF